MIIFTKKYHEAIKEGKLTLTFRAWDTLKVLRGKIYRAYNLGLIKVLDVDFKRLNQVTNEEIRNCGYKNMEEFREDFVKIARREGKLIEYQSGGEGYGNIKIEAGRASERSA